jgi:tRNA-(ms[2]io[6]A)-hydroxylase
LAIELPLRVNTSDEWLRVVLSDFDEFLRDHADCERKASAQAISLVSRFPHLAALCEPMITLAKEELQHFHEVFRILQKRGSSWKQSGKDEYVRMLLAWARHSEREYLLDRLLISSVIEARGCERLKMVADALDESDLKTFYMRLAKEEAGHYRVFLRVAEQYYERAEIEERMDCLLVHEAKVIESVPLRAAVH